MNKLRAYPNNNLSNKVGGISNIRATDGGNIASFRSNDSKIGQYIDVNSKRVVINYMENGEWKTGFVLASKADLFGRSIYVAGDGGTQNFNIGNNGFLFIPYTSTAFGIYYLGINSAKLILGTEDSNFKVSISGTTCMLQNNKGWNIFCVFITGQ